MIKTILFDLDGTLLPMDQDVFVKSYFSGLAKKAAPYGYEAKDLIGAIWTGTAAMVKNDGSATNEQVFWNFFQSKYGSDAIQDKVLFDEFYEREFELVQNACGYNPQTKTCIETIKSMSYRIALATNPIFPEVATRARIRWAGLDFSDFSLCTTYENSCFCKPNLDYYRDILNTLGVSPEECLMVGNDVEEDMVAARLGMEVFLITDCLINRKNRDISIFPNGTLMDLLSFLRSHS